MATEKEVEALIRERSAATGSLSDALQHVHDLLLSPEQRGAAVDVFPSAKLAGAVGRLCRCRGMIQEVQPEIHLLCASPQHFFSPTPTSQHSDEDVQYLDAVSLYVIPVPGNDHFYALDEEASATEAAHASSSPSVQQPPTERKRRDRGEDGCATPMETTGVAAVCRDTKLRRVAEGAQGEASVSAAADALAPNGPSLNFPHPALHPQLQTACIVTVPLPSPPPGSADRRRNPFRINDVVDFFGYQHFPDDQLAVNEEDDFAHFSAWNASELSKGLVSRLLCMAHSPVSSVHQQHSVPVSGEKVTETMATVCVAQQRTVALRYLAAHITQGDELAAEYLLLHLCAKVTVHSDALPVGDLPLLITGQHINAEAWSRELRRVSPVAELLVKEDTLRSATPHRLTPRYHNELNYLQSGLLQVANGSHVTVDCTALGTRDAAWHEAMFALVHKQVLLLDYPYQTLELPVDVSVLALHSDDATTAASLHPIFHFALRVRWQPTQTGTELAVTGSATMTATGNACTERDAAHSLNDDAAAVRQYLAAVRRLSTGPAAAVDDGVFSAASDALLEMTRELPGWNNRDPLLHNSSFSAATALMRAHAASWGRPCFGVEDTAAVKRLETARVARLGSVSHEERR